MIQFLLSIDPVAFHVFGVPVRWYAIFITSGMLICLLWGSLDAKRRGISEDFIYEIFIVCVPLAIVFARVVYVLAHPDSYFPIENAEDFKELFAVNHGGLTIIGGIFGAIIGAVILSRFRKKNLIEMMDFGMPFMLLGQALGRWGNFVNQEAYGMEVTSDFFRHFPLGVYIDRTASWHYATFFYEMVLNIIGFIVLLNISHKSKKRGITAIMYFVWYGIVRGLMEFLREDAVITDSGIYITQLGSFLAAGIGIILIILIEKRVIRTGFSMKLIPEKVEDVKNFETVRKSFDGEISECDTSKEIKKQSKKANRTKEEK
jgi:phosphatidylglycerol:prolipoprotein diacylglycerol transferase